MICSFLRAIRGWLRRKLEEDRHIPDGVLRRVYEPDGSSDYYVRENGRWVHWSTPSGVSDER